jgi:hypothetical protein
MSTTNQSWGYLLPMIGVSELLDSEIWDDNAIKFSSMIAGDNTIENVSIRGHKYDLINNNKTTKLYKDKELIFSADADMFTVRNYKDEGTISFQINAQKYMNIEIFNKQNQYKVSVQKGIFLIEINPTNSGTNILLSRIW